MDPDEKYRRFLGAAGYLIQEYGPKVKAAQKKFYRDPQTYFKLVEEFRSRLQLAEQSFGV